MATNNEIDVKYSRLIQKHGTSESMPKLASGEIGFMYDAGRAFIGSDPSRSTLVNYNRVTIIPFMNAQATAQAYLDNSIDYNHLKVEQDLSIDAGSKDIAVEVADFLNSEHRKNSTSLTHGQYQPIALVDSNIEFVTNKNVAYYAQPWDFNVKYGAVDRINSFGDQVQYQLLDTSKGDLFLQFPYQNIFYITVEYLVIQNDGLHTRSGKMIGLCDNTFDSSGEVEFKDHPFELKPTSDSVSFDAQAVNGMFSITFNQPYSQKTKIFYRINRWNIEEYIHVNNYYEEDYIGPLSVNDKALGTGGTP